MNWYSDPIHQRLALLLFFLLAFGVRCGTSIAEEGTAQATQTRTAAASSAISPKVERLIKRVEDDDPQVRTEAIVELGSLGEKSLPAARLLVGQLAQTKNRITVGTTTSSTAYFAVGALRLIGTPGGPALLAGLKHENDEVRQKSAELLGQLGYEPAVDLLIERLGDANRTVAGAASSALNSIGQPAFDRLLKVLVDGLKIPAPAKRWIDGAHPDPNVPLTLARQKRNYSAGVLGKLGDAQAIGPLLDALDSDDQLFRRWAAGALAVMDSEECQAAISHPDVVRRLLGHLETVGHRLGRDMIRTLRRVSRDGRGPMLEALNKSDRQVRVSLFHVWFTFRDDYRIVPALLKRIAAGDDDATTLLDPLAVKERSIALRVVPNLFRETDSADDGLPLVVSRLNDPAAQVRSTAGYALSRLPKRLKKDRRVIPALLEALQREKHQAATFHAIQALGELRDPRGTGPLIELLRQKELFQQLGNRPRADLPEHQIVGNDTAIRQQICMALGKIGDRRAIPALRERLPLKEPFVIKALVELGDLQSIPELLAQLKAESIDLRTAAAKALQGMPDSRSIDPLAEAMKEASGGWFTGRNRNSKGQMIGALAQALAVTGEPRAASLLVAQLRSGWSTSFGRHDYSLGDRAANDPRGWPIFRMGAVAIAPLINELKLPHASAHIPVSGSNSDGADAQTGKGARSTAWSREVSGWALEQLLAQGGIAAGDADDAEAPLVATLMLNEPSLQYHAARALGIMRSKAAIPELIRLLATAADDTATLDSGTDLDPVFVKQRREKDELIAQVASALSRCEALSAKDSFATLLNHRSQDVRKSALHGLLSAKHPRKSELLIGMLTDDAAVVREEAAQLLGFTGDRQAVQPLVALLTSEAARPKPVPQKSTNGVIRFPAQIDTRQKVIAQAAQSLGMLGDSSASAALLNLATSSTSDVRFHAVLSLVQLNDDRCVELLRELATSDDDRLRERTMAEASRRASSAIYRNRPKLAHPGARAILIDRAKNDPSTRVLIYGAGALRGFSDSNTVEALLAMCRDPRDFVRRNALIFLLKTTDARRYETLKSFLTDESSSCRTAATYQYAEIHNPDNDQADSRPSVEASAETISRLLNDPDEAVRESALKALSRLHSFVPAAITTEHQKTIQRLSMSEDSVRIRHRATLVLKQFEK